MTPNLGMLYLLVGALLALYALGRCGRRWALILTVPVLWGPMLVIVVLLVAGRALRTA